MALLCLLLMAAFYLAVIIGQPQEDETASTVTPRTDQPLLPAGQDVVTITSADDLPLLLRMFPAPALTPTTSGWPLVVGTCYDVAFENGMGRILTLTYQASDTIQVTLTSIYPAGQTKRCCSGETEKAFLAARRTSSPNRTSRTISACAPSSVRSKRRTGRMQT